MADVQHDVIPLAKIHPLLGLGPYADEAARLAAAPASTDVGKAARQTDTGALWELKTHSPLRWQRFAGPVPVRTVSGAGTYTCVIGDEDGIVRHTSASAVAPTIPPNSAVAFAIGCSILFRQAGAGLMTLTAGVGVTLSGSSLISSGQHSTLCATKVGTDTWDVSGKTT